MAARHPDLAAAIAQAPTADGPAASSNAARYTTTTALLRLAATGVLDALGGLVGRPPLLIPTSGRLGTVSLLSTPDALQGTCAPDPQGRYPHWQQTIAARSALRIGLYRPGRYAPRVRVPLLVVVSDEDQSSLAAPAQQAPHAHPAANLFGCPAAIMPLSSTPTTPPPPPSCPSFTGT